MCVSPDRVAATLEACGSGFGKCALLLLCRRLLLLLRLPGGGGILSAALAARRNRTRRCARSRVPAGDFADHCAASGATNAGTRSRAGRCRRRCCRLLLGWGLRWIEPRLLDRPRMAGRLVALLLLGRLTLRRIHILLCG